MGMLSIPKKQEFVLKLTDLKTSVKLCSLCNHIYCHYVVYATTYIGIFASAVYKRTYGKETR